jgi:hypothetical protein
MDFAHITPYVVAANFLLTWGIGFYVHLVNKNKATIDRIERMESEFHQRLILHSERLGRIEAQLAVVPTHDDLGKLYRELNETSNQVSRLAGEMSHMNDNLRLLLHNMSAQRQH